MTWQVRTRQHHAGETYWRSGRALCSVRATTACSGSLAPVSDLAARCGLDAVDPSCAEDDAVVADHRKVSWQDVAAVRDGRGPDVADAQLVWIRRRAVCRSGQAQQAPAAGECADQSHLGGVPHRQPGTRQLPCVTGESV